MPFVIKIVVLFFSFTFAQSNDSSCPTNSEKNNNSSEQKTPVIIAECHPFYPEDGDSIWVYKGKSKWKINKNTILDMEIYCRDLFFRSDNETAKQCVIINRKNKSWKDSIAYKNGTVETDEYYCNEFDSKIIRKRSSGSIVTTEYDSLGRIVSEIFLLGKGDTLSSERYVWGEKGRLMRIITRDGKLKRLGFNDYGPAEPTNNTKSKKMRSKMIARDFIYGTPCDSVKVEPTDKQYYNDEQGYDNSFGKIPEESDGFEYSMFTMNPYYYRPSREILEKQKLRCEEYKEEQLKKEDGK